MPPAIEPLIGPTIDAVLGMEAKSRTTGGVIADGDKEGDDVADALNYRIEPGRAPEPCRRRVFGSLRQPTKVGLGWVEVRREQDPSLYPYSVGAVHRNEIWYGWLSKPDLSDARYLVRRKWMERDKAKLMFPEQADLIEHSGSGWQRIDPP